MKNVGLKATSAVIALLLMLFVSNESNMSVRSFIAPIEVQNLPENKVLLLPAVKQAQVAVRGPSYVVSRIAASPPVFEVAIPEDVPNRYKVRLLETFLALPPSVEVVSIDPPNLELILDNRLKKTFPVVVPKIGNLGEDFQLINVKITPDRVMASGPETEFEALTSVETEPVDLRDLKESVERELRIRPPGRFIALSEETVTVAFEIAAFEIERTFPDVPIEVRSRGGHSVVLNPARVTVGVSGSKEKISELTRADIIPFVRVAENALPGEEAQIFVELPKDIHLMFLRPEKVQVRPAAGSGQ